MDVERTLGRPPPEDLLVSIDPLLAGIRAKIAGRYQTSDKHRRPSHPRMGGELGLAPGIPIPTGAFDAHWDAVGANIRLGDVVNVIGTSTCIIGITDSETLIPGVCGVVPGSVYPDQRRRRSRPLRRRRHLLRHRHPRRHIRRRAIETIANYKSGQTGLLRLTWDNGDRTVLVNPALGGVTFGWNLTSTAADELFAAIEGTAMHTRIILERMESKGTLIRRVINGGGIPQRNATLNQVYANVLNKPVLVTTGDVTSLGSVIFAFLAAGDFPTVEAAQDALCPTFTTFTPQPEEAARAEELYQLFRAPTSPSARPTPNPQPSATSCPLSAASAGKPPPDTRIQPTSSLHPSR